MEVNLSKRQVQVICEALELLAQKQRDNIDVYLEAYEAIEYDIKENIVEDAIRGLNVFALEIDELAIRLENEL